MGHPRSVGPQRNNPSLCLKVAAFVVRMLRECRAVLASGLARPGFHDPGLKPTYLVGLGPGSWNLHDQTGVLMICEPYAGGWPIHHIASPRGKRRKPHNGRLAAGGGRPAAGGGGGPRPE